MLWLEWEGGQLPIGWDAGPAATIDSLFGTSWKVYEGVNTGNGMTVVSPFYSSALPDKNASDQAAAGLALSAQTCFITQSPSPESQYADSELDEQHSMLPDTQFSGSFAGDLKDWFEALVRLGRFSDATYVNIGNAG